MKKFMNLSIILLVATMCAMLFIPSEAWGGGDKKKSKKSLIDFGDAPPVAKDKKPDKQADKKPGTVKDTKAAKDKRAKAAKDKKDKEEKEKAEAEKAEKEKAEAEKAEKDCGGFKRVLDESTKEDKTDTRCPNEKEKMKEALQELMTPEGGGPPRDENGKCPYGPFDNELVNVPSEATPQDGGVQSPTVSKKLRPCNPFPKGVEEAESYHLIFYIFFAIIFGPIVYLLRDRPRIKKAAKGLADFLKEQKEKSS